MATETFNIDLSHSSVSFSVRHMVIAKVHGRFARFSGAIALDEQTPSASSVNVTIEAASIDTNGEKRTVTCARPTSSIRTISQLTFVSSKVERPSGERFLVSGDLTIHGVTKPITLDGVQQPRQRPLGWRAGELLQQGERQPPRLRPRVEPGARGGRRARRGQDRHHARDRGRQSLSRRRATSATKQLRCVNLFTELRASWL